MRDQSASAKPFTENLNREINFEVLRIELLKQMRFAVQVATLNFVHLTLPYVRAITPGVSFDGFADAGL